MMKKLLIIALLISIYGCAAGYYQKENTFLRKQRGGYSHIQLTEETYKVTFEGNANTRYDRVNDLCLLRCAELCINNGYTNFYVTDKDLRVGTRNLTIAPEETKTKTKIDVYGNTIAGSSTTTTTPAKVVHEKKYIEVLTVTFSNDKSDEYTAKYLIDSITQKYNVELTNPL